MPKVKLLARLRWPPADHALILGLALVATTALTIARFSQSFWIDEATSVWFARQPVHALLTTLCDPHPAGYYVFLKPWLLISESEAWLRVPSLMAGLLAIYFTYRLAAAKFGSRVAGLAALMLALQPLHGWYASEVRMYALVEMSGVAAIGLGWRLFDRPTWRGTLAYVAVVVLAMWIDYSAILPVGLLQLMWIAMRCPYPRRWLLTQVAAALPVLAFMLTPTQWMALSNNIYPIFLAVRATASGIPLTPGQASLLIQLALGAAGLGCVIIACLWNRRGLSSKPLMRWSIIGLWIAALMIATIPQAFTVKRRVLLLLPFFAIAAAYVVNTWPKAMSAALCAATAMAAGISIFTLQRDPWRAAVQDVLTTDTPAVVWVDELSAPAFDYYRRQAGAASMAVRWAPLVDQDLPQTPQLTPPPNGTLWVMVVENPYRQLLQFLPADFFANYQPITARHETGIGIYQFQRRAQPDPTALPPPDRNPEDAWGLLLLSPLDTCTP